MGRNTGCDTCRKRKIKCDRSEPACVNCVRSGWQCPGYPPKFEFQEVMISSYDSKPSSSRSNKPGSTDEVKDS
ncbi:hypothetical protein M430DRAFT_18795 [Amorphotheca resinae ATCC 22711]|uniref:Zn(2)-C6 fungal-type domain-containing protein n=1 Tax=Amorphotheca resinae ATCC 22711 TaxID=857342 RepID=A0A2T3B4S9_AMORE|nr:hypothetical protein M430DRAFT_18795 [Amorphotheca resinae ATCC 22711]PSS20642.1 hypothetical protein M430DRAFT_18795 [Amorphotheca resinae ATCC 22711]